MSSTQTGLSARTPTRREAIKLLLGGVSRVRGRYTLSDPLTGRSLGTATARTQLQIADK